MYSWEKLRFWTRTIKEELFVVIIFFFFVIIRNKTFHWNPVYRFWNCETWYILILGKTYSKISPDAKSTKTLPVILLPAIPHPGSGKEPLCRLNSLDYSILLSDIPFITKSEKSLIICRFVCYYSFKRRMFRTNLQLICIWGFVSNSVF